MICRLCKKQSRKAYHPACRLRSQGKVPVPRTSRGDIGEPKNCVDQAEFNRLIAERKLLTGDVPFIRSRIPVDDSPAAEMALRPEWDQET